MRGSPRSSPSTAQPAASIAKCTPSVAGLASQRLTSTRLKWPCPTSTTLVSEARASASTESARAATCSAVSPFGQGWVQTVQPGTVLRISSVVMPS